MFTKAILSLIFVVSILFSIASCTQGQTPQTRQQPAGIPREMTLPKLQFPEGKSFIEVPFEVDRNHMVIPISVNGSRPLKFGFDTGAQGAILYNSTVGDSLNLNIVGKARVRGAGSGEGAEVSIANDVTFDIGGIKLSSGEMLVAPPAPAGRGGPQVGGNTDGVIGRPIFASLVVEVDWERQVIKFYDPAKYNYLGKGKILPLTFDEGGRPYTMATAVIAGDKKIPVKLVVDTGASQALSLDIGSSPEIKAPVGAVKVVLGRGASGEITGLIGRVKSLRLGNSMVKNIVTDFPDASQGTAGIGGRQGRLGAGVLKRFKITYDYSRQQMIIEPNKFLNDPFEEPRTTPKQNAGDNASPTPTATQATSASLQDYVGRYGNKEISVQNGELFYQRVGGRGAMLKATGKDKFTLNGGDAQITFVRNAQESVIEMLVEWNDGVKEQLKRETSAQPQSLKKSSESSKTTN